MQAPLFQEVPVQIEQDEDEESTASHESGVPQARMVAEHTDSEATDDNDEYDAEGRIGALCLLGVRDACNYGKQCGRVHTYAQRSYTLNHPQVYLVFFLLTAVSPSGIDSHGRKIAPPTAHELRMIGAATSVSFKKSGRAGLLRPLTTLPPFVPRLFIEDISLNHDKYKGFDAAGRDLTAASKTLKPSIIELQAALMIADVTGFTKLTEILSKKGACYLSAAD